MHIPRIGHEMIVDFPEGDPDRPIIKGRVYHAERPVPYALPDNKTQCRIKTRCPPGSARRRHGELRRPARYDCDGQHQGADLQHGLGPDGRFDGAWRRYRHGLPCRPDRVALHARRFPFPRHAGTLPIRAARRCRAGRLGGLPEVRHAEAKCARTRSGSAVSVKCFHAGQCGAVRHCRLAGKAHSCSLCIQGCAAVGGLSNEL